MVYYPNKTWLNQDKRRDFSKFILGRTGIDYKLNMQISIGVQYLGGYSFPDIRSYNTSKIINNTTNLIDSLLLTNSFIKKDLNINSINVYYKADIDTLGRKMFIDLDYLSHNTINNLNNANNSFVNSNSFNNSTDKVVSHKKTNIFSSRIDFIVPTKFSKITFGGKVSFTEINSDLNSYRTRNLMLKTTTSDSFVYKENTQALYLSSAKSIGKWKLKAGVRLELTQTKGNSKYLSQIKTII